MVEFAEQVAGFVSTYQQRLTTLQRKVALGAFSEVIQMSPVDTGRFRGNWQCAVGPQISLASTESMHVDPAGGATLAHVAAVVDTVQGGETIWLVNGLPYARRLEYGWSKQAPGGMVRLTVQRWKPIVEAAVKELNK